MTNFDNLNYSPTPQRCRLTFGMQLGSFPQYPSLENISISHRYTTVCIIKSSDQVKPSADKILKSTISYKVRAKQIICYWFQPARNECVLLTLFCMVLIPKMLLTLLWFLFVLVLLSAHAKRFGIYLMRFFLYFFLVIS